MPGGGGGAHVGAQLSAVDTLNPRPSAFTMGMERGRTILEILEELSPSVPAS